MDFGAAGPRRATREAGGTNVWGVTRLSEVRQVDVASLLVADSPRLACEQTEYTRLLADGDAELPPIVVHTATMRVVDGMYRVRAASLRGQTTIAARFFDGSPEDAFVLAVEANTGHGLPLSLSERTTAAGRILATHPHLSDRAIASVTGLSAKTVGSQRRRLDGAEVTTRIGRDGRARPVSCAEGRRIAARIIRDSPHASLRHVAQQSGVSPGTVRDVRARLSRGEDVVPGGRRTEGAAPAPAGAAPVLAAFGPPETPAGEDLVDVFRGLCRDPSLRLTDNGRQMLRMVEMHLLDPQDWERVARSVPPHRAQMVSAMALECARLWNRFAHRVHDTVVDPVA
ncbi:streptomycin biosynthesis regulator [Streptomyces sp. NPDC048416]|uniref:streptomycin biosynthesis regulator n=1 Tax=Streptomyces sp. NPDC048416 TaxID=3365546 RepID=UPI003723F674